MYLFLILKLFNISNEPVEKVTFINNTDLLNKYPDIFYNSTLNCY